MILPFRKKSLPAKPDSPERRFVDELAARGQARAFKRGELLIREGDADDTLFLIVQGTVRVFSSGKGRDVTIDEHGPGRFVGEMALDGGKRSASVEATEAVDAIAIPREAVLAYLGENPEFALSLVMTLIRRARLATENLKNLALRDVYGRVAGLLQAMAEDRGSRKLVPGKLTQLAIAQRVGASREMVSIILRDLTKGGYIRKSDDGLELLKPLPPRW